MTEPGTHSDAINRNMKRSADLIKAEDLIEDMEERVKKMRRDLAAQRKQHQTIQVQASLRLVGRAGTWRNLLDEGDQHDPNLGNAAWSKENVLAILSCDGNTLPEELSEKKWLDYLTKEDTPKYKRRLCYDLDIFLARLKRPEFENDLDDDDELRHWPWLKIFAPLTVERRQLEWLSGIRLFDEEDDQLRGILASIVSLCPEIFRAAFSGGGPCKWSEVAKAYVRHCSCSRTYLSFRCLIVGRLENDHDLMILCNEKFHSEKKVHGSTALLRSCRFAYAFAKNGYEIGNRLEQFDESVRSDFDVAKAFCRANGLSYPHVSLDLRQKHEKLARLACKTFPDILLTSVPGTIERQLTKDKQFILSILKNSNLCPPLQLMRVLPPALTNDPEIIVAAVTSGIMRLDEVPVHHRLVVGSALKRKSSVVLAALLSLQSNPEQPLAVALTNSALREHRSIALDALTCGYLNVESLPACWTLDQTFWRDALFVAPELWASCHFAEYVEFAQSIKCPPLALTISIIERFPQLSSDLPFWRRFLKNQVANLGTFLCEHAADVVLRDKDFIKFAISRDVNVYDNLIEILKRDRSIVETLISTKNYRVLFQMDVDVRTEHPDLVVEAMKLLTPADLDDVDAFLEPEEWQNRDIVQVYITKGGSWDSEDVFPGDLANDEELMLLVAVRDVDAFHLASEDLRGDKAFILKALDRNGMVYRYVIDDFKHDFDVVLAAWATSKEVGDIFFAREDYRFMTHFAKQVRDKLRDHDIFFKTVLCGTSSKASSTSPLRNLLVELGTETSMSFRKRLADLLDISTGEELAKLRDASAHMGIWGY